VNQLHCLKPLPALRVAGRFRLPLVLLSLVLAMPVIAEKPDPRGARFLALDSFRKFKPLPGEAPNETVLLSREISPGIPWNELIVSWNAAAPPGTWLKFEARAVLTNRTTKFYHLGLWSPDPALHPRESLREQQDADGDVKTDTLVLREKADRLQLRITLGGAARSQPRLKFLGVSVLDNTVKPTPLPPNRQAWGATIAVPERSQMAYPEGGGWCSPATISMLLANWSAQLERPELDNDVPVVVAGVNDPKWEGTGNWVFNTAYAGSFKRMRAYTTRLTDVSELEDWIARGIPVGLSLCYNRLRGLGRVPSGHLVVCVGFTNEGDVIVNDPGTRRNVRKTFSRERLIDAWSYSQNTVYLVYPEAAKRPRDRFGHWE
jgi:hypothetical protein